MQTKEQWIEVKTNDLVEEILKELEKASAKDVGQHYGYKVKCIKEPLNPHVEVALFKKFADKGWKMYMSTDEGTFKHYALI